MAGFGGVTAGRFVEKFVLLSLGSCCGALAIKTSDLWELGLATKTDGCIPGLPGPGGGEELYEPPLPLEIPAGEGLAEGGPGGDFADGTTSSTICPGTVLAAMAMRSFTPSTLPSAKSKFPL